MTSIKTEAYHTARMSLGATVGWIALLVISKGIAGAVQPEGISADVTFGLIGWLVVFLFIVRECYQIHMEPPRGEIEEA